MWYKIADGPLDIVGKTLKVVTSLSDTPIIASKWNENIVGAWVLSVREDEPYIRESIYVLNNFSSGAFVSNGTPPLTGIFVSENIRSISIAESEVAHKIEAKYLPSKHILALIDGDTNGEQTVGAGYVSAGVGGQLFMNLIFTEETQILSLQDMGSDDILLGVDDVQITRVGSTIADTDGDLHSYIEWSSPNACFMIHLPETTVTDTFCITYKELIDEGDGYPLYKSSSFILYVNSHGGIS